MNDLNTILNGLTTKARTTPIPQIAMHPVVPHLYTSGFKYVFAYPFNGERTISTEMVELFGLAIGPSYEPKSKQFYIEPNDKRWFSFIGWDGIKWIAFKEENDAVLFKLRFSPPGMISKVLPWVD